VFPTTGIVNNITHVTVDLANPFTSGITITKISSNVSTFGLSLGTIQFNTDFAAAGKKTTTSPALDLNLNFNPSVMFTVTRALAVEAGEDPTPLDGITQLGGINYLPISGSSPPRLRSLAPRANVFTFVWSTYYVILIL
jgi:hypothetical protein